MTPSINDLTGGKLPEKGALFVLHSAGAQELTRGELPPSLKEGDKLEYLSIKTFDMLHYDEVYLTPHDEDNRTAGYYVNIYLDSFTAMLPPEKQLNASGQERK